jgi:hypothetical protein
LTLLMLRSHAWIAAFAACALATAVAAMAKEAQPESSAPVTNLQVLPADLSRTQVRAVMKQYERDLGVSCDYCHVEDRDSGFIDYASDDNPRKHSARVMIAMLEDINGKYLAQLGGDRRYAVPVTCGSCHQGSANPQAFSP